jgi:hypothetical protein
MDRYRNAEVNLPTREDMGKAIDTLGNTVNETTENVNQQFNDFSKQAAAGAGATMGFLQSNTIIAKFAFIILVLILFLVILNVGILLMSRFLGPQSNPYLVQGMVDGTSQQVIPQDTNASNAVPIYRSNNEKEGAEFTWSFWLYISDLGNDTTGEKFQHIFSKGDGYFDETTNKSSVNNAPGVYLEPGVNNLHILMDTVDYKDTNNKIIIENVPLNKWFHVAIRLENKVVDAYVNGVISNRIVLNNVVKQNYHDVHIGKNGGFNGKLSNLRYYREALTVFEINSIVKNGPNLSIVDVNLSATTNYYSYLSNSWYASKY